MLQGGISRLGWGRELIEIIGFKGRGLDGLFLGWGGVFILFVYFIYIYLFIYLFFYFYFNFFLI